jgi:hypothetical protein
VGFVPNQQGEQVEDWVWTFRVLKIYCHQKKETCLLKVTTISTVTSRIKFTVVMPLRGYGLESFLPGDIC